MHMIRLLSYSHGDSVNFHGDLQDTKTENQPFDSALKLVSQQGHGAFMSKGNIKSAFRIVPLGREDWHLLGIYFNDYYYVDICLPFRASIPCTIFEQVGFLLQ